MDMLIILIYCLCEFRYYIVPHKYNTIRAYQKVLKYKEKSSNLTLLRNIRQHTSA